MKHNTLKKTLSLLLVICMMASFAGCIPGEEDPTEPSTIETTGSAESTAGPTDGTTAPTDNTDATASPTEETQAPTTPTETETEPPATETPNTDPTFATEVPTESPVETFVDVVETVYAISTVNVRSGPSTDDMIVGSLSYGESVQRTGIGNKGWSRVDYNGEEVGGKTYAPGAVICTLTTDSKGHAQTGNIFPVGTYTIRESAAPTGYLLNKDWQKIFSVTESKKDHSFSYADSLGCPETVISGKIQITKKIVNTIDSLSAPEAGAKFSVTDSKGNVVDTITIGENGVGISKDLPYGSYTVTQISCQAGTILVDSWTVTVNEHGKVYEYNKENPLWTAFVSLHKKEAGSETPLVGTFELCEQLPDGTVKVLETGTTDADGNLAFTRRIVYTDGVCNKSTYFIRESVAPAGYVLNTKEYPVSCTENNQVITVTMENAPIVGKLELRKQSTQGKPMQGVEFLLEYSLDEGKTWNAITLREDDTVITPGTCTSKDLKNGRLLTNADGIAVFEGLRVYTADGSLILYRVTETKTLNGSTLMPGPIWEGDLLTEKEGDGQFEVVLGVANSPILELPETGSKSLVLMPLSILLCLGICAAALFTLRKKKEV